MKYFNPNRTTDFRVNKYGKVDLCLNTQIIFIIVIINNMVIHQASLLFFLNDGYEGGEI